MKTRTLPVIVLLIAAACFPGGAAARQAAAPPEADLKPRVIVLTDLKRVQETDDAQSLVRLLAMADLVEIEGLIVTSGWNYWSDDHAVEGYALVWEMLDAYGRSVENLMKRSGQRTFDVIESRQRIGYWPSSHYLKQRTALGTPRRGMENVGTGKASDGSRLITGIVDEEDPRPVYVLVWGGPNVLAQVFWDLTENPATKRTPEAVEAFVEKLRVVAILDQDQPWPLRDAPSLEANAGFWLRRRFPDLFWIWMTPYAFGKAGRDRQPFYRLHIQGHGALGDRYPDHANGVEGDSPSLFYVLPLGLGDPERPDYGGPAGVFVRGPHPQEPGTTFWSDAIVGRDDVATVSRALAARWTTALWNMLAARMDWARAGTGNRPPIPVINGHTAPSFLELTPAAGTEVRLDAGTSRDAESDNLTFRWSVLELPRSYRGRVDLHTDAGGEAVRVRVPADAAGAEIHVLLELTDDGAGHPLTAFRRVVIRPE